MIVYLDVRLCVEDDNQLDTVLNELHDNPSVVFAEEEDREL